MGLYELFTPVSKLNNYQKIGRDLLVTALDSFCGDVRTQEVYEKFNCVQSMESNYRHLFIVFRSSLWADKSNLE